MELPKNVTRVGQADSHCKIYVEDYVMTYLKQMNTLARNKEIAVALYGIRREEEAVSYLFIYGAGQMNSLQRETRHLSQAQNQEIEKIRKSHFQDYRFLGYRILNGEMIEGMHICEQGICRYVEGYAQFYEKNDLMLAYMLSARKSEAEPEKVNQEKYENINRKREERRMAEARVPERTFRGYERKGKENAAPRSGEVPFGQLKVAVVLGFAVLCMIGVASVKGSQENNALQTMGDKIVNKLAEDKILDDTVAQGASTVAGAETVTTPTGADTMASTEAAVTTGVTSSVESVAPAETTESAESVAPAETTATTESAVTTEATSPAESVVSAETTASTETESTAPDTGATEAAAVQKEPVSYIIAQGDTLIAISIRMYGDDSMVNAICELNQIEEPDDIKIGQKILLP